MLRLGLGVAVLAFLVDRLSKWWLIGFMDSEGGFPELTPFFNLVMVWNRGASFGLFSSDVAVMRWVFVGVSLVIAAVLVVWLARTRSRWLAFALGLVVGGALGNVVDRLIYGAVADFFDFHVAGYHWPAFNMADSAIVVGVGILLLDGLFGAKERPK